MKLPVRSYSSGPRRHEECYRRALEACRARRRATELPASHELCLLELPAIGAGRSEPGLPIARGQAAIMAQDPSTSVVAAPPPPPAAAKPPVPPASPHPRDRDDVGATLWPPSSSSSRDERVLAAVVDGRLPGFGFENDAASTSLKALVKRLDEADDASTALEDVIKTLTHGGHFRGRS